MDSKLAIQNKDIIINELVKEISLENSNALIILKGSKQDNEKKELMLNCKGSNKVVFIIKDDDIKIDINNKGKTKVNIKAISKDKTKVDLDTKNQGAIDIKANCLNFSSLEIIGKLIVEHEKTESHLSLDSLNIDANATKLIPILKVRKSNVKVSHSALSHKIMPSKIFYLTSKGINKKEAKEIIIKSYITGNSDIFQEEINQFIEEELRDM